MSVARLAAKLGVVVVTYNSAGVVDALLDSVPGACAGLPVDVVVVDNGSTDGTPDLLEERGDCLVVRAENLGYSAGINAGTRRLRDVAAVMILNPDVRLQPRSVRYLYEALIRHPDHGVAAPRVLTPTGRLDLSLRREPTLVRALGLGRTGLPLFSEYVTDRPEYEHGHAVDWAMGAALLVSSECLAVVGDWDESYFLYSEETDFCLRARRAGFLTWFEPSAVATHIGGASGRSELTHTMQILNRVRLYARHHGAIRAWIYWLLTLLSELSWVARGQIQSRAAVRALLRPSRRPPVLGCSGTLVPL